MPGGIPTGGDPSQLTPFPFSIVGAMVGGLQTQTEENVRPQLQSDVQNNATLNNFSSTVFSGINPQLGMVAGIIEAMLRKIIGSIPIVGPIAEEWTGELLDQFETYFGNLGGLLGSINFMDPDFDPTQAAAEFVNLMLLPLNLLLGNDSPLNANSLFGLLPAGLLGFLPASSIGEAQDVNLITNPDFEGDDPIESSVFDLDLDTSFSAVGGSAKVTCDGTGQKDLMSPDLIRVSTGQEIKIAAMVEWEDLVGTGTPIRVGITGYDAAGAAIIQPDMATHNTSPSDSGWIELGGTYKIANTSVVTIRLRLTVGTTATAGFVWWDHISLFKTNKISTGLIADANGNGLPDLLDGFQTSVTSILGMIPGFATVTQLFNLQDILGGSFGSTLTAIQDNLANFLHVGSPLQGENVIGSVSDGALPGLLSLLSGAVSGLLKLPGGGYTQADASAAFTHTADTMATLSAQVEQLRLDRGSGIVGGDEFERLSSNLGADWDVTYTGGAGTMKTDGHNAYFDGSGTAQRVVVGRYIPLILTSDYQVWSVTLNSAPETAALQILPPVGPGSPAFNDVLGRMNATKADYIRFRVGNGQAYIDRVVAGIVTNLNTQSFPTPGPGSTLTLVCGAIGTNSRYFKGMVNGQTAVEITEIGTASIVDSNHRQGGAGGLNGSWTLALRQSKMGSIKQILGADQ